MKLFPESGFVLKAVPFIRIDLPESLILPEAREADVIITSGNAVAALRSVSQQLPVFNTIYCIAGRTEALVTEHLKARNIITRPYAADLVEALVNETHNHPLWFLKGDKALPTIPEGLQKAGIALESIEVYQNKSVPHMLHEDFEAILFFSPSAVESFAENNFIPDNTITFAIGKTTADALKAIAKQIVISDVPTEESVTEAVVKYFNLIK